MKKNKGITLITLIITIIVMLILVAVSVNVIIKSNLIGTAEKAVDKYNKVAEEEGNSGVIEIDGKKYNSIEDYMAGKDKAVNISTLVGKGAVAKNTKAVDAYENKITIPKGFKVLAHNPTSSTGAVTYNYTNTGETGDHIPAVQDGIVIEDKEKNQFVWVPVGEIKNKDNTTNTIILGRYSDFTKKDGAYTPVQSAEDYAKETVITANIKNKDYTIARLGLEDEKENTIKINKAIQLEGIINDARIIKTAPHINGEGRTEADFKELITFREGTDSTAENATARDLKTFKETTLANGGYYIARFEASGTTSKITSKYNQTILKDITQPNAAKLAREMYGEVKENNELVYASDLVNSYAWDTAIIFIQTYSTETDASSYASENKSTAFTKTGINNDRYCNIWDMSGNACEWTTEYANRSSAPRVFRGGYCSIGSTLALQFTSYRYYNAYDFGTSYDDSDIGLRALLYVK